MPTGKPPSIFGRTRRRPVSNLDFADRVTLAHHLPRGYALNACTGVDVPLDLLPLEPPVLLHETLGALEYPATR